MVSTFINAQETNKSTDRIFGIGYRTINFLSDLQQSINVIPGNRMVFTINPHPNFRIQPEFGYYQIKENSEVLSNEDLINKNIVFGLGFYGMWKKDKTNLYAGLKYTTSKITSESARPASSPIPPYNPIYTKETETIKNNGFGIIFGGEYFLSNHFSVGTEVGIHSVKTTAESTVPTSDSQEANSFLTETNLLLRFYF